MENGPIVAERRANRRVKVEAVAFVFKNAKLNGYYQIDNISETGMALVGKSPLENDELVDVLLQFSGRSGVKVKTQVVHCSQKSDDWVYLIGMRIIQPDQNTCKVISEIIQEAERTKENVPD